MANTFSDISNWLSGDQLNEGQNALRTSASIVGNTAVPDLAQLIPQLKLQVESGKITPAQAQAAIQEASAYSNINVNPQTVEDQLAAVNQLKQVATQGGMTAIDKAQLNDIQQQLANQNAAQQQAIQTAAAQQGLGTAGSTLAQKMLASQGNSTAQANAGANIAANAQARALQAMQQYGSAASAINNQQYAQQKNAADAANAINQFNAQNRQAANIQYAANQQAANTANVNNQNTINANNTGIANVQARMPYEAAQSNFTNTMNRNVATSNALNKQGTAMLDQGNKQANTTANTIAGVYNSIPNGTIPSIINGVGSAASAVGSGAGDVLSSIGSGISDAASAVGDGLSNAWDTVSSWFSDEELKTGIKPADEDVEAMMEKLTGKKWKYKSDTAQADGGKEHISPMAQDIEKAGLPVMDTPQGKLVIDNDDTKGAVLAALGNLHQRVKQLEK
jgi:hypothetical protein